MPRVQLEDGRIIEFDREPSPQDVEEAVANLGGSQVKGQPNTGGSVPMIPLGMTNGKIRMGLDPVALSQARANISKKSRQIPQRQIELIQDTAEVAMGMDDIVSEMDRNKFKTGITSPRFYPGVKGDLPMQLFGKKEEATFKAKVDRHFQKYRKVTTGVQAGYPELQWLASDVPKTTDRPDILVDKAYATKEIQVENLRNMFNVLEDTGYDTTALRKRYKSLLEKGIPEFNSEEEAGKANLKKGTLIRIKGKRAIWDYTDKIETPSKVKYLDELDLNPKETTGSLLEKTPQAMAAFGLGVPAAIGLGKAIKFGNDVRKMVPTAISANYGRGDLADNFANKVNEAFVKTHTNEINKFGNDLTKWTNKYPNRGVDLSELVTDIQADPNMDSRAVRILRKTPKLDALLDNPKLANNVPLKDAQEIINHLNSKVKVGGYDIQEAINNVKGAQLESFPEMKETRATYANFKEPYKQVKNYFKVNKTLPAIENKFGGAQGNVRVSKIMPEEIMKQINAYRFAVKAVNPVRAIAKSVMGGVGKFAGVAPQALQIFNLWRLKNDPEAQYNSMLGGGDLPPAGSLEREIKQGRII